MARSRRFRLKGVKGARRFNFNWDAINIDSAVIITAAEWGPWKGALAGVKTNGRPNLGAANVYVTNIGPHGVSGLEAGGVEFLVHADWNSPLDVMITVTVLENIESFDFLE